MKDTMRSFRLALAGVLFCIPAMAYAITTNFNITVSISALNSVFNCTGFATSGNATTGNCGVRFPGSSPGTTMQVACSCSNTNPSVSGTTAVLVPLNSQHVANNLNYEFGSC